MPCKCGARRHDFQHACVVCEQHEPGTSDTCDQCGAKRQTWQSPESDRCTNHANPYGSCDGTLRGREDR